MAQSCNFFWFQWMLFFPWMGKKVGGEKQGLCMMSAWLKSKEIKMGRRMKERNYVADNTQAGKQLYHGCATIDGKCRAQTAASLHFSVLSCISLDPGVQHGCSVHHNSAYRAAWPSGMGGGCLVLPCLSQWASVLPCMLRVGLTIACVSESIGSFWVTVES